MGITDQSYGRSRRIKRDMCLTDGTVVHSAEDSQILYIMLSYVMLHVTHNKQAIFFIYFHTTPYMSTSNNMLLTVMKLNIFPTPKTLSK